ncbi:MAG: energy-coupling factor transporter transmembrane component T family protein [Desulfitobacteriaceae bacterium]
MDEFTLYLPGDSLLHNLDPRLKIGGLAWLSFVMTMTHWSGLILGTAGLAFLILLSRLPRKVFRSVVVVSLWMALFYTLAAGWIWTDSWYFWRGHWSMGGLEQAALMVWKIVLIFALTRIFVAVTPPLEQGLGIAYYFGPLTRITPKAADFALLITLTLRFIPLLAEEALLLWKARVAKGAFPEQRVQRIIDLAGLFPPLLLLTLRRAEEVADNLLARGYAPGHYRNISMHAWIRRDSRALLFLGLWGAVMLLLG